MESEKYICVRERVGEQNQVAIIDIDEPSGIVRRPITADSAIMHPKQKIIALKAGKQLQVFNLETKSKLRSHLLTEEVTYWRWIGPSTLALVTDQSVFHWTVEGAAEEPPKKIFDRLPSMSGCQIISYRTDSTGRWLALVGISSQQGRVVGSLQLFHTDKAVSQPIEGHAACFAEFKAEGAQHHTKIFSFAVRTHSAAKIHFVEIDHREGAPVYPKAAVELFFPPEAASDFPVALQASTKFPVVYCLTKYGFLHIYDLESASCIYMNRISSDTLFISCPHPETGGVLAVNRRGQVLLAALDEANLVPYLLNAQNNPEMAIRYAAQHDLPGADELFLQRFQQLINERNWAEAAKVAARSPRGLLRTPQTLDLLRSAPATSPGGLQPLLQYLGILLETGAQLSETESLELATPLLQQAGKKNLLERWLKEGKLTCSAALGDVCRESGDASLALSVYLRAEEHEKVCECFAELAQFSKLLLYVKKTGIQPNYLHLLHLAIEQDPQQASEFAKMLVEDAQLNIDGDQVFEAFASRGLVQQATAALLTWLKQDLPEQGHLQTRLVQFNIEHAPAVADAILSKRIFSHFNRPLIAQLCEQNGLIQRALELYTDVSDLARVLGSAGSDLVNADWLASFFSQTSAETVLLCFEALLQSKGGQHAALVGQVAAKLGTKLDADQVLDLIEPYDAVVYQYLSTQISSSKSPRVHFAFIKAAARQGHLKELERVCRESTVYEPHAVKRWLMEEANLSDQLPLVIVCDRHNLVHDLVTFLHAQGANRYIEVYVQRVNPARAADVIAALLDVGATEETVTALLAVVPAKYPLDALVQVLEERHRLSLLRPYLEARIRAEPNSPAAHTALLKVLIEGGAAREQAETMLRENRLYEPLSVGYFCEQRGEPDLALLAYARGQCDAELLRVTSEHGLYRQQAGYLLRRRDAALWKHVLEVPSAGRTALLEQLVQNVGPESNEAEEVSACVKGLLAAGLHPELLALLERIVLQTPGHPFASNKNLQNLLLLTSIKHAPSRVREQLERLQAFDGAEVSKAALAAGLAEEALLACRPQRLHAQAMEVLVGHLRDFGRAYQYAEQQGLPEVWARLGRGLLAQGMLKEAVDAYVRAEDASDWQEVVRVAQATQRYEDLARYLTMARTKLKDAALETELLVALGVTNQIGEVEAALKHPNLANLATAAERCYEAQAWQAARLLFTHTANHARLAVCLLHLKDLNGAVEAARRANSPKVWAELVSACVAQGEWKLAQQAGIQLLNYAEEIDSLIYGYESLGHVEQLISLLEAAQISNANSAGSASSSVVCTELACLYARHRPAALMEHLTLHWSRLQPAKVVAACEEAHLWSELCFLHLHQDDLDRAVQVMIEHAECCWEAERMHKALARAVNPETLYRAIQFYREEHPLLLNEMLMLITARIDPARVIERFEGELSLIRSWMQAIQGSVHLQLLNQSLNEMLLMDCDAAGLQASFQRSDRFDTLAWADRLSQHGRRDVRRLAADLFRRNRRWSEALELLMAEGLWSEAIELVCASNDVKLIGRMLSKLVEAGYGELYVLLLWRAGDLIPLDMALEGAWKAGWMDLTMPFICGSIRETLKNKK